MTMKMITVVTPDGSRHLISTKANHALQIFSATGVCPENQVLFRNGARLGDHTLKDGDVIHLVKENRRCDLTAAVDYLDVRAMKIILEEERGFLIDYAACDEVIEVMLAVFHPFIVRSGIVYSYQKLYHETLAGEIDVDALEINHHCTVAVMALIERARNVQKVIASSKCRMPSHALASIRYHSAEELSDLCDVPESEK